MNTTTRTMHGIGHVINAGQTMEKVIDFENKVRRLNKTENSPGVYVPSPLPDRKPDVTHNKTFR